MQESQHDAHYSSQDREVVHCFQVRYVEHHNMLEAASLRADTIQDLTQQLPIETSFISLVRACANTHTHTHRIQQNFHARFSRGKWLWMLHWHGVQVTNVTQHTMYSILVELTIQAPILHSTITISIPLPTEDFTIKDHHRLNQD